MVGVNVVKKKDVANLPFPQPTYALLMEEARGAKFQVVPKVAEGQRVCASSTLKASRKLRENVKFIVGRMLRAILSTNLRKT